MNLKIHDILRSLPVVMWTSTPNGDRKKKGLTNHQQSLVRAYCITETIILLVGGIPSPLKNNFVSWDDETPK